MIEQVNPLDIEKWKKSFLNNSFYSKNFSNYNHIIFSYQEMTLLKASLHHTVYEVPRRFCKQYKILDAVPYYYIDYLLEKNPKTIVDIGCGENVFKDYLNIIGIDSDESSNYDIFDNVDEDYAKQHKNMYDAIITINTIHFEPITEIFNRINLIKSMLASGGRAFVSFNVETWLMHTNNDIIKQIFGKELSLDEVLLYIHKQIKNCNLNLLVYDWPILKISEESSIRDDLNGNVRIVFEKE